VSVPTSTYRLQVRAGFDLHAVADLSDYLATLGVGALYLSPLLPSAKGSDHGYDVKHLIEVMLTSRAYQLPAVPAAESPVRPTPLATTDTV